MSIAAILGMIESRARETKHQAERTSKAVEMLQERRSFFTKAEYDLTRAKNEILSALKFIEAAEQHYASLPVNDKAA